MPGCMTQGQTIDEVETNLREAVKGWLSVAADEANVGADDRVIEVAE